MCAKHRVTARHFNAVSTLLNGKIASRQAVDRAALAQVRDDLNEPAHAVGGSTCRGSSEAKLIHFTKPNPLVTGRVDDVDTPIDLSQVCSLALERGRVDHVAEVRAREAVNMAIADVPKTRTDRRVRFLANNLSQRFLERSLQSQAGIKGERVVNQGRRNLLDVQSEDVDEGTKMDESNLWRLPVRDTAT